MNTNDNLMSLQRPSQEFLSGNLIKSLIENQQKKSTQLVFGKGRLKVKNCPTQIFGRRINLHSAKKRNRFLDESNYYQTKSLIKKSTKHAVQRKNKDNLRFRIEIKCPINNSYT